MRVKITERGNGLPSPKDMPEFAAGSDGNLYRIFKVGGIIMVGAPGVGNFVYGHADLADWDEVPEGWEGRVSVEAEKD